MNRKIRICSYKTYLWWLFLLVNRIFLIFSYSCQKDKIQGKLTVEGTNDVSLVDENTVTSGWVISIDDGEDRIERGVCWGTEIN